METEAGSQIALEAYARSSPPFLAHQFFPGGRTSENMNSGRHAPFSTRPFADSIPTTRNPGALDHGNYNGPRMEWDVKTWDWDSVLFLAQPSSSAAGITDRTRSSYHGAQNGHPDQYDPAASNGIDLRLDGVSSSPDQNGSSDHDDQYVGHRGKHPADDQDNGYPSHSGKARPFLRDGSSPEEDAESLSLKLGGHSYAYSDEGGNGSRDAKRYRSSSPGPLLPSCQVDDCKADLSHAKDYHRRHKVCEMHAKAVKVLVGRLMQRFCQQCSRFHLLAEFDEGKRSCRRRLAGHNRRRRKNQPDVPPGRGYMGLEENGTGKAAGLVGFLNLLSSLQAVSSAGALNGIVNEHDALLQYLKKGALSPPNGLDNVTAASVANLLNLNGVVPESRRPELKSQSFTSNGHPQSADAETEALLSALAAPKTTEALSLLLQTSLRGQLTSALMKAAESPLVQVGQSNGNGALPVATPRARIPNELPAHANTGPVLSLSSPMPARPLAGQNLASLARPSSIHQQVIPENSVQQVEHFQAELARVQGTPLSMAQKLFPLAQVGHCRSSGQFTVNVEDDATTESTCEVDAPASMMTFREGHDVRTLQDAVSHHSRPTIDLLQHPSHYDTNESSPSGSDQSPSSSYSDWQDRTGRISIKLFDRNPGELPHLLRSQILDWLAHRPSDMESYIRPGCTVLTVFLTMPNLAWIELERDLRISLQKLTASSEFWSKGRIHMQVDRRNAFIVDGKIHVSRPLRTINAPQLLSVRPIAIVAGQKTNIVLRGSNLRQPETRIFCAYQGKYTAKGVPLADGQQGAGRSLLNSAENEAGYDEISISFDGGCPDVVGRAFIEVEKQMGGGNALPIIVADGPVCAELQMLEDIETQGSGEEEQVQQSRLQSGDILHQIDAKYFLNELGWLFQKSHFLRGAAGLPKVLPSRQKNLLTFAVQRDWCAVVNKLLDIFFGFVMACPDKTSTGLEEIFGAEVSFLHMAVRRKCIPMVQLLLSYVPSPGVGNLDLNDLLKDICKHGPRQSSIFTPDMIGPEGLTPLHIAASMDEAEGIIDALTSDPNQIGLHAWSNAYNSKGESPLACALNRGNASYVQLVRRKIDRRDGLVTIDIPCKEKASNMGDTAGINNHSTPLCSVELSLWSKNGRLENTGGGKSLVIPSSCRHVPPSLRGYRHGSMYRPFLLSMVAVAAVCVCACIIMKGPPQVASSLRPFSWGSLSFGSK